MTRSVVARALKGGVALLVGALLAIVTAIGGVGVDSGLVTASPALSIGDPGATAGTSDLSVAEIGSDAAAAGFHGTALTMAIAVALAESSGNPAARNVDDNGTVDRGVWQINSVHASVSDACAYDPPCAARATYAISDAGTNWEPWVTYQHGAEIAYLPEAIVYVEQTSVAT